MAAPGERLIAKGQKGESMFFIASGRLHVELEDRSLNLSSGEFVGELALLTGAPRNATVVARGFAYLFELDARDLRRIMRRSAAFRAIIERRAHERLAGDKRRRGDVGTPARSRLLDRAIPRNHGEDHNSMTCRALRTLAQSRPLAGRTSGVRRSGCCALREGNSQ